MHLKLDPGPSANIAPPIDSEGRHSRVGYWHETIDITPGKPLEENLSCDVAVVGAGYTGLSTAYYLKKLKPELDVVVLDSAVVGHCASGRNGGFVMPLLGWDLLYTVKKLGEEKGREAYTLMYDAIDHARHLIREHEIECDMEETGYLCLNPSDARERRSREEFELAHRLGFEHDWLEGEDLAEHVRSDTFVSGIFDPRPFVMNPAKLARGLKTLVEKTGVRVYEQTPLLELKDDDPVWLRTPGGEIRAKQVMLAVNGFGPALGFMSSRILPAHTFIVLTEPLTSEQLETVAWGRKRTSLESSRNLIHYFRLTADNRALFGGEDAKLYFGGRYVERDEAVFEALKNRFRAYFPPLADVKFTHEWGGILAVTLDMFPTFGSHGERGNIFFGGGYSGHGVALSIYSGAILAPQMLRAIGATDEAKTQLPFFYDRRPAWLGFEPFRYLGALAYRSILRTQDRINKA